VGTIACAMLLKMSILKMSSNTEIREKGECAAVRAVGQGLWFMLSLLSLLLSSTPLSGSEASEDHHIMSTDNNTNTETAAAATRLPPPPPLGVSANILINRNTGLTYTGLGLTGANEAHHNGKSKLKCKLKIAFLQQRTLVPALTLIFNIQSGKERIIPMR